jgi:hypothetical protein
MYNLDIMCFNICGGHVTVSNVTRLAVLAVANCSKIPNKLAHIARICIIPLAGQITFSLLTVS